MQDAVSTGTAAFTEASKVLQYGSLGLCFFMAAGMLAILAWWMWLSRDKDKDRTSSDKDLAKALQSLADAITKQGSRLDRLEEVSEDTGRHAALIKADLDSRACCATNAALKALQKAHPSDWQVLLTQAQANGA